ncbi:MULTISPECIES: hypothetical protein [unclassified Sphingobium]|uniref:hypothetical protein n=1 Tax=unclassified Sphingobium TaxID=2611147 RepID=UPI0007704D83|nr:MULTISPECIES: hypothetical protein [unclassified Sphingobium]AMK22413.1 hypothetical protein K426_07330 [Sphingobium sp. TKS]NML90037.1 hypothetical protein [Sphingobium sp. TB-6]
MIRTLIFGAIAGYVGKKLYDEGKLTEFKDDLVARYNQARTDLDKRREGETSLDANTNLASPATHSARSAPLVS